MMEHHYPVTVFYEDTDMAGIVYYANYLKFIERARSTMVREMGIDQNQMKEEGVVYAVREVHATYHTPARLNDDLDIVTTLSWKSGASTTFHQAVYRGETLVFKADVVVVCILENGRPTRMPAEFRAKYEKYRIDAT